MQRHTGCQYILRKRKIHTSWFIEYLQKSIRDPGSFPARLILGSLLRIAARLLRIASWTGQSGIHAETNKKKNQEVVITSLCILPAPKLQSWLFSEMIAQVWISCAIWGSWIHTLLSLEQWVQRCLSHRKNRMDEKFFPHNGKPSSQDTKRVVCLLIQETGFKLKAPCGAN